MGNGVHSLVKFSESQPQAPYVFEGRKTSVSIIIKGGFVQTEVAILCSQTHQLYHAYSGLWDVAI